jgi:hypothetical protein
LESLPLPEVDGPPHTARSVIEAGELKLAVQGVARYWATGGNLIQVDPEPGARPEDLLLYLTGAVMGAVLHQRGAYPVHASCVALGLEGVALAGPSGAGKSTLVAALVDRGARFVADDVCVLTPLPAGGSGVWPGAPRTKLDRLALSALERGGTGLEPAGGTRGKLHLPVGPLQVASGPVPLRRVYLIRDGDGPVRTERLAGLEGVAALLEETYFLGYAVGLGLTQQCFRLAGSVAQTVQISRLVRPHGIEHLSEVVELITSEATPAGVDTGSGWQGGGST